MAMIEAVASHAAANAQNGATIGPVDQWYCASEIMTAPAIDI